MQGKVPLTPEGGITNIKINYMKYPTLEQVECADQYQLCKWHRFLRSPETDSEIEINKRMFERWKEVGGFTPEISKAIGW